MVASWGASSTEPVPTPVTALNSRSRERATGTAATATTTTPTATTWSSGDGVQQQTQRDEVDPDHQGDPGRRQGAPAAGSQGRADLRDDDLDRDHEAEGLGRVPIEGGPV